LAFAFACGGKSKPPPPPKAEPPEPPAAKRVPVEDDEQEPGVSIVHAHGHMEKEAVEAGIAPHKEELLDCYLKKVGRRVRWLGGHVKIHWDINKEGTVTKVVLSSETDLGAWPIEKCLLDVARAASFDKPIGGDADFDLPLDFEAKGSTLHWDEDQSSKAIGPKQLAKIDACGKTEGHPKDVTITVYVGPHGRAQSVGFSSDRTELKEKWADCAEKAALAWKLPDPKGMIAKAAIRYRP
jgi:hypothetical protein